MTWENVLTGSMMPISTHNALIKFIVYYAYCFLDYICLYDKINASIQYNIKNVQKTFPGNQKKTGPKQPLQSFKTSHAYIEYSSKATAISAAVR